MLDAIGGIIGLLVVVGLWVWFKARLDQKTADAQAREQAERNGGPGPIKPK